MSDNMEKYEELGMDRNKIAAILSVVPGLGHIYKHHYLQGIGLLTLGNMMMVLMTALLTPATFGVAALLVPALYLVAVGFNAYEIPDWHGRHDYLHPWRDHEKHHQSPH